MKKIILTTLLLLPVVTLAQEPSLQNFLRNIPTFFSDVLIPFLFAIAFLALVYNTVRYFVIGGNNEKAQESARSLALYSVYAFLFLICLWGIVSLLTNTLFGTEAQAPIQSDYIQKSKNRTNKTNPCAGLSEPALSRCLQG